MGVLDSFKKAGRDLFSSFKPAGRGLFDQFKGPAIQIIKDTVNPFIKTGKGLALDALKQVPIVGDALAEAIDKKSVSAGLGQFKTAKAVMDATGVSDRVDNYANQQIDKAKKQLGSNINKLLK